MLPLISSVASFCLALVLGDPGSSFWLMTALWITRLVLFLLTLRTYIIPFVVGVFSQHIRVRSISFRSIRGLYIRTNHRTWRVDRIVFSRARLPDGLPRISVRVEGLKVEFNDRIKAMSSSNSSEERQALSLADFGPSSIAFRLWVLSSNVYELLSLIFRPVFSSIFVSFFRHAIQRLPSIAQALLFEISSAEVTFVTLPGTRIVVKEATLHASLSFIQADHLVEDPDSNLPEAPIPTVSFSAADWKARFTKSTKRAWDRAWGKMQGTASISLAVNEIHGTTTLNGSCYIFMDLPGSINVDTSIRFDPKRGTISRHGLTLKLRMDAISLAVDSIQALLTSLRVTKSTRLDTKAPTLPSSGAENAQLREVVQGLMKRTHHDRMEYFKPRSTSTLRSVKSSELSLSFLKAASINVESVRLFSHIQDASASSTYNYEAVFRAMLLDAKLSHPSHTQLHRECLGKTTGIGDGSESDAYAFGFSFDSLQLNRRRTHTTVDDPPLLSIIGADIQVLLSQWPSPWLAPSPFLSGDPNAPLIAIRVRITNVDVTERVDDIHHLLDITASTKQSNRSTVSSSRLMQVPRMDFALSCGEICVTIRGLECDKHHSLDLQLRTERFLFTQSSDFVWRPSEQVGSHASPSPLELLPLQLNYRASAFLAPTFVRVLSSPRMPIDACVPTISEHPLTGSWESALSLETVEIRAEGSAFGAFQNERDSLVTVDKSSTFLELHCSSDALSIELWHPDVILAWQSLSLSLTRLSSTQRSTSASASIFYRLPFGISAVVAISRLIVFVTQRDINPADDLQLSRGSALRTGICLQYCALRAPHIRNLKRLFLRSQTRHKLGLPEEQITKAISTTRATMHSGISSLFLKVAIRNAVLRSCTATQYAADDPYIAERDDPILKPQEFLRVSDGRVEFILSGRHHLETRDSGTATPCQVTFYVPYIWAKFKLVHAYDFLLAMDTLKSLRRPRNHQPETSLPDLANSLSLEGTIKTIQVVLDLPKQCVVARLDSVKSRIGGGPFKIRWDAAQIWVPIHNPEADQQGDVRWEELLSLHNWETSLSSHDHPLTIAIQADSGRFRIPSEYVVSGLILDIILTLKCLRHLAESINIGKFAQMPSPGAESARLMPHFSLSMRCFCAEASDDNLESQLALIWRVGLDASQQRMDREEAFRAKVATIFESDSYTSSAQAKTESDYQFNSTHTVSLEEARERLYRLHAADWSVRHKKLKRIRTNSEKAILRQIFRFRSKHNTSCVPNLVHVAAPNGSPPLFRVVLHTLSLKATPPSFPLDRLPDFLYDQGKDLPRDTSFSLLLPMHLHLTADALRATLRDYTLPLLNVPSHTSGKVPALEFDADLVVAEELANSRSIQWLECEVLNASDNIPGTRPFSVLVPKTAMPVKTYAKPVIQFHTDGITAFSWGVSYSPATRDIARILETLTTPTHDLSPALGFWDKIRLVLHWNIKATFQGEVRLHMKGSRDPHHVLGNGAGFVLCWKGHPMLLIGHANEDNELAQLTSDSMIMAVPKFEVRDALLDESNLKFRKVCAKLDSGVQFGIGLVLERACGEECGGCNGPPFSRKHRYFTFSPHYRVSLDTTKVTQPPPNSTSDSYNGFRSDFIHLSISLVSSKRATQPSNLYLTPKLFAHFWSWMALFDDALSLPIRQGSYYPPRSISPKFGAHLATIKYRISVPNIFISHVYLDDSSETWVDGVTPFVGVKALIRHFQADMHQRLAEILVPGIRPGTSKLSRRHPVYAAYVLLKDIDLRALLATFDEPMKRSVPVTPPPHRGKTRKRPTTETPPSLWFDPDDFVEIDWSTSTHPDLHLLPVAACPRFTYFKQSGSAVQDHSESSKFGIEDSHTCLLENDETTTQIQINIAEARVLELKATASAAHAYTKSSTPDPNSNNSTPAEILAIEKKISLLTNYITQLGHAEKTGKDLKNSSNYLLPSNLACPDEWSGFANVYQIHCPKIFMDQDIRDILLQYYRCSRARRGFEYHMAQRAVRFVREQAGAAITVTTDANPRGDRQVLRTTQAAASALRKIFTGDIGQKASSEVMENVFTQAPIVIDPLRGWSGGVSLRRSHFCLLLKPQIVLRGKNDNSSTCILAAVQAKLQSFLIIDDANVDDAVCGQIMTRNYTSLNGLQTFAPANTCLSEDGCIPLEVLIDFRCESEDFDRLVPQTDATLQYDKFNRLRLRSTIASTVRTSVEQTSYMIDNHLQNETDLIQVHVPRFTVSATDRHFKSISDIVTNLVLFSDAAHKTRLDRLQTLLFTYDFTDLVSAAHVISELQGRLRNAFEIEQIAESERRLTVYPEMVDVFKLKLHIAMLAEELGLLFDAIKLAQDRTDDQHDQKSALLLHATSAEISWRMLDDRRDLLAKLAMRNIEYSWLSRQDSSTVNNLAVGDLQVFDGSPHAVWPEILCKQSEPASHILLKRGIFAIANWTVLPPVGGITIYEEFTLNLHPMRLQVDAKVGSKILEYVWPARKLRRAVTEARPASSARGHTVPPPSPKLLSTPARTSFDDASLSPQISRGDPGLLAVPSSRRLGTSKSFTDLRSQSSVTLEIIPLQRTRSTHGHSRKAAGPDTVGNEVKRKDGSRKRGDAAEMKTRSSQKTFVLVRIYSLHLLLSVMKEGSFECHDARIRTRDLEYRNQTWSFEELVNQFIPSHMGWRGWIKMVFHQPLVPILPVARELLSKTKLIASKGTTHDGEQSSFPSQSLLAQSAVKAVGMHRARSSDPHYPSRRTNRPLRQGVADQNEPDNSDSHVETLRPSRRKRILRLITRPDSSRSMRSGEPNDIPRIVMESPEALSSSESN